MRFVSFDPLRTLGFPDTLILKPEHMQEHAAALSTAERVLFPEHWQLSALLYVYRARIFPSEASYRIGHNKIEMTRAFQALVPRHVPETLIAANTPTEAERLFDALPLPFVAKVPKSSRGEGVWLIETAADWRRYLERSAVLYVQEYLPIDRDLRVVVVGDRVQAAYWRKQSPYSFHNNVARGGEVEHAPVPQSALTLVSDVARRLGVDHAGFDVAMVGDHPYLFELNRLFGTQGLPGGDGALRDCLLQWLQRPADSRLDPHQHAGGGAG